MRDPDVAQTVALRLMHRVQRKMLIPMAVDRLDSAQANGLIVCDGFALPIFLRPELFCAGGLRAGS